MVALYNKDCLHVMRNMPGQSVDMILTDPPYGMQYQSNYRKNKYSRIIGDDQLDWLPEFMELADYVLSENSCLYLFCSFHNIDVFKQAVESKFKLKNILTWEKNNHSLGDLRGNFAAKTEFILFAQKGRVLINGNRVPNIFKFAKTLNRNHPTEKPVNLCAFLMEKFSRPGDVVFDPFMGSGTTGVACLKTGRKFIGAELSADYFATAEKRIFDARKSAA